MSEVTVHYSGSLPEGTPKDLLGFKLDQYEAKKSTLKVKVIFSAITKTFEERVSEFTSEHDIVGIQYAMHNSVYHAFITYRE